MCLGVPGKVVEVGDPTHEMPMGKVEFGGVVREVCLACTPDASVGDYVLVHAGLAISKLDEAEANEVLGYLRRIDELDAELAITGEGEALAGPSPGGKA